MLIWFGRGSKRVHLLLTFLVIPIHLTAGRYYQRAVLFLYSCFVLASFWSVAVPYASARTMSGPRHHKGAPVLPAMPVQDENMCQAAIHAILPSTDLPSPLLGAIGKVESGRLDPLDGLVKPWPWTINAQGQGIMFDHREEAVAAVLSLKARGIVSIDVGCMQVNLAYHPNAFATLDDAFDPAKNVQYAARFLRQLFARTGNWDSAAGAYHSKTPSIAEPYQMRVLAAMGSATHLPALSPNSGPVRSDLALAWAATVSPAAASPGLGEVWSAGSLQLPTRSRLSEQRLVSSSSGLQSGNR